MRISGKKEPIQAGEKPISSRLVLTVVFSVSVIILLILLIVFTGNDIISYFTRIFGNGIGAADPSEKGVSDISDMNEAAGADIIYEVHEGSAYDTLMSLNESTAYSRVFRVTYTDNGETYVERSTLTVYNELFRVENTYYTVIYDGERLYVKKTAYTFVEDGKFSFYDQTGITPLEYVKNAANSDSVHFKKNNPKVITVEIKGESNIDYEYEVSIESGLVIVERSYLGGVLYRSVVTDKIEITEHKAPDSSLFIIPEE